MTYRVGVDIGGTFIDFCVYDEATQELATLKVLTTPGQSGWSGTTASTRRRSRASSTAPRSASTR